MERNRENLVFSSKNEKSNISSSKPAINSDYEIISKVDKSSKIFINNNDSNYGIRIFPNEDIEKAKKNSIEERFFESIKKIYNRSLNEDENLKKTFHILNKNDISLDDYNGNFNCLNDEEFILNQDEIIKQIFNDKNESQINNDVITEGIKEKEDDSKKNKITLIINNNQIVNNNIYNFQENQKKNIQLENNITNNIKNSMQKSPEALDSIKKIQESKIKKYEDENQNYKKVVKIKRAEKPINNFLKETTAYSKKFGYFDNEEDCFVINSKNFGDNLGFHFNKKDYKKPIISFNEKQDLNKQNQVNDSKNFNNHKFLNLEKGNISKSDNNNYPINIPYSNVNNKKKLYPISNHNVLMNKLNNKLELNYNDAINKERQSKEISIDDEIIRNICVLNNNFSPGKTLKKHWARNQEIINSIKNEDQERYKIIRKINYRSDDNYNNFLHEFPRSGHARSKSLTNCNNILNNSPLHHKKLNEFNYLKSSKNIYIKKDYDKLKNIKNKKFNLLEDSYNPHELFKFCSGNSNSNKNDIFSSFRNKLYPYDSTLLKSDELNKMANYISFNKENQIRKNEENSFIFGNGNIENKNCNYDKGEETIKEISTIIFDLYDKISLIKTKLQCDIEKQSKN